MPDIVSHIQQANKNLKLIEHLVHENDFWDWKVTISFYTCLHIVNAHLARIGDLHYQRHGDTQKAIDPAFKRSTKTDEDTYVAYRSLRNYSNRARYLSHEKYGAGSLKNKYSTNEVHYAKVLRHLNKVIQYFSELYSDFNFTKIKVKCSGIKNKSELKYLEVLP